MDGHKKIYREWWVPYNDAKLYKLASKYKRKWEGIFLWPFIYEKETYILAVFSPFWDLGTTKPRGFLLFNKKHELITDKELTLKIAKYFVIFRKLYHFPPIKVDIFRDSKYNRRRDILTQKVEQCKKNLRETSNVNKKRNYTEERLADSIRKLEQHLVENYRTILLYEKTLKETMDIQKKIYEKWTYRNLDEYFDKLQKLSNKFSNFIDYNERRAEIYQEYELIRKAHQYEKSKKLDLLLEILPLGFAVKIILKNLPDLYEHFKNSAEGSKAILKNIESLQKDMKRINNVLSLYSKEIDEHTVRLS